MASPLVWLPDGLSRFVWPKLLLVAVALITGAVARSHRGLPTAVSQALAVFVAVFVVAALAGGTPVASLVGRYPRYEGLPVLLLYFGCLWLGSRIGGAGPASLSALGAALGCFSILAGIGLSPVGAAVQTRSGSVLGNATDQGLVAMVVAVALIDHLGRSRLVWVGCAGALAAVALSGSRAALLLTGCAFLFFTVRRSRGLAGAVVALLVAAFAVPTTRDRLVQGVSLDGRWGLWTQSVRLIAAHPVVGVGPSGFEDAIGRYQTRAWMRAVGAGTLVDSPHDVGLQILAAGGLALLAAALATVVVLVRAALPTTRPGAVAAVTAFAAAMTIDFTSAGTAPLVLFLAGSLVAVDRARRPDRAVRSAIAVASVVAAIALVAACLGEVRMGRGDFQVAHGRYDAAELDFTWAHRLRPWDSDVHELAAQLLATGATSEPTAATATMSQARAALRRTPTTYGASIALAQAFLATHDYRAADAVLDDLAVLYPARPQVFVDRAIARAALGETAAARLDVDVAQSIDPDWPGLAAARALLGP